MLAAVSLLASCQPLPDKPAKGATREVPAPSQSSVDSSPTVKPEKSATKEALAGRYQMISTPTKILMPDTTTGRTWFLAPNSVWQPLEIADGYKNETRMVAELVAESLIAPIKIYNPNGRIEPLTEAQKKQRVDANRGHSQNCAARCGYSGGYSGPHSRGFRKRRLGTTGPAQP